MPVPTLDEVRRFWTDNPLFAGEGRHALGSREWFVEHERVYFLDGFVDQIPPMLTRDLTSSSSVLDAGCGPGIWVRWFARRGISRVTGCDLTSTAVSLTRRSLELFGLRARVDEANIEALPYADHEFDHVNCQGVIHHTPNPERAIGEFHRVLRPGGTLCLSVYHRNVLLRSPLLLRALRPLIAPLVSLKGRGRETLLASANPDEIVRLYDGRENPLGRSYTIDDVARLLAGRFEILESAYYYFPARTLPIKLAPRLHAWLSRHAGLMLAVRCRSIPGADRR